MKELQVFNNEEFGKVRVVEIDNEPWLVGKDITEILGYENQNRDIIRHVDEEDRFMVDKTQYQNGIEFDYKELGQRGGWLINESGLYSLVLGSKLPAAKKFKRWVTSEVLPTIRKHGMYATDELLNNPDLLIEVATKLKEERAARIAAEKERNKLIHQSKLYTSSEIAKELGMSSAAKLNKFLEEKKIQYKLNNTWLLYSEYSESGLASIKQQILDNGHVIYDRRWTGKGRDFILDLYLNRK